MIAVTVNITVTPTSLRDLINTAVTGKIPTGFWGRAFEITLIPSAATIVISDSSDVAGNNGVTLPNAPIVFRAPTGNQIALEEMFFSGAGTETMGVLVLSL